MLIVTIPSVSNDVLFLKIGLYASMVKQIGFTDNVSNLLSVSNNLRI